jgi:hypothetical protein
MKKVFLALALVCAFTGVSRAQTTTATGTMPAQVVLSWQAPAVVAGVSAPTSYTVYRETAPNNAATNSGCYFPGTTGTGPGCLTVTGCVAITVLTCTDNPGVGTWYYVVRSNNAQGQSPDSNEVQVIISAPKPTAPNAPASLTVTVTACAGSCQ